MKYSDGLIERKIRVTLMDMVYVAVENDALSYYIEPTVTTGKRSCALRF